MRNVFYEDWRACLRSHYKHVVLAGDAVTEPSLRSVLKETGFTDAELDDLKYQFLAEAGLLGEAVPPPEIAEEPIEVMEEPADTPVGETELPTLEAVVLDVGPEATLEAPSDVPDEAPVPEAATESEPVAEQESVAESTPVEEMPPPPPETPTVQLSFF